MDKNQKALRDQLIQHRNYHYRGAPLISDQSYDELQAMYVSKYPDDVEMTDNSFGIIPISALREQVKLEIPMGSLPKIKILDIESKEIDNSTLVTVMPKYDGWSTMAKITNNAVSSLVTKGDGEYGDNILESMYHSLPFSGVEGLEWVRGECVVTWDNYHKYFEKEGYTYPRGAAACVRSESELTKYVDFVAYSSNLSDSMIKYQELQMLKDNGFNVASYRVMQWGQLKEWIKNDEYVKKICNGYCNDGLVVKVSTTGEEFAIKLYDEEVETTITNIEFGITRTGRLVPVWVIDPVFVAGATLTCATANNVGYLNSKGAGIGSRVMVYRANGIIPQIGDVLEAKPVVVPTECPVCGTKLVEQGEDDVCPNTHCAAKEDGAIDRFINWIKVDGLGGATYEVMLDEHNVHSFADLNNLLEFKDLSDKMGPAFWSKLQESYEIIKDYHENGLPIYDILMMSNIPRMGHASCLQVGRALPPEKLVEYFKVLPESDDELGTTWYTEVGAQVENIIEDNVAIRPAFDNFIKYRDRVKNLLEFIQYKVQPHIEEKVRDPSTVKVKYCMTGTLSKKRALLVDEFDALGGEFVDIGHAEVLIANAPEDTGKYKSAVKKGIPILTESEFRDRYFS